MSLAGRVGRGLLTATVTFFAVWTLCYQVALAARFPALLTFAVSVALWLGALLLVRRRWLPAPERLLASPAGLGAVLVAAAVTLVVFALARAGHRPLAADVALVAVAAYLVRRWLRRRDEADLAAEGGPEEPGPAPTPPGSPWLWRAGWALGVLSATATSLMINPDADDAYFVNASTWVAAHDTFPLRDTMLSDQVLPGLQVHTPNVSSIESLFGVLARLAGVSAGTMTYVVMAPLLVLLATLALTWLVAESRIPAAPLGLAAAVGSLWMSGTTQAGYSGYLLRVWQGKEVLFAVAVPLLVVSGVRLLARGRVADQVLFGSAVVASVGVSNTAVFLTPALIGGLVLAALATTGVRSAVRVAAWAAYPLAVGVAIALTVPPSPTRAQVEALGMPGTGHHDPLVAVPGAALGTLVLTLLGLGLGWLGIRDRLLRVSSLASVGAVLLFLLPPVQDIAVPAAGIGSVVWRIWWLVPGPLLTAGVVGLAARLARSWRPVPRATALLATAALVAFVPLVDGVWVGLWHGNDVRIASPLEWKVPKGTQAEAQLVRRVSRPGEIVLAPRAVSRVLAGLTVAVHPVAARPYYLPSYLADPGAKVATRVQLQKFADTLAPTPAELDGLRSALQALDVRTVCLAKDRTRARAAVTSLGWHTVGQEGDIVCLRR